MTVGYVSLKHGVWRTDLGGASVLFVPSRSQILGSSDLVDGLWDRLSVGMWWADFASAVDDAGLDPEDVFRDLMNQGLIEEVLPQPETGQVARSLFLDLAGVPIGLHLCDTRLGELLHVLVGHLQVEPRRCDDHIVVAHRADALGVATAGEGVEWSPWEEAVPAVKIALTDCILEHLGKLILHTAAVSRGSEAMLISGEPGMGKSTLSVALGASEFCLEGDDIAYVEADGRVAGIPFPATLKDGSWPMLTSFRPDLENQNEYIRPDDETVRYLPHDPNLTVSPKSLRCLVCLARGDNQAPEIQELTPLEGLAALLEGAWSKGNQLTTENFEALAACVASAPVYRITYSDLLTAVKLAQQVWERSAR
ncbi:MAG: hypothetical protein AAGA71_21390 [Pseudomonadota bacterium]